MRLLPTALACVLLCACSEAPPPRAPTAAPAPGPQAPLPVAPWDAQSSVSEGYEAEAPPGPPILLANATLLLGNGKRIAQGSILLDHGKIAAVAEGKLDPPAGAVVIDATGKYVMPGIVDTHSHLGVYPMPDAKAHADGNEMTNPTTPEVRSVDAFWAQDPAIQRAVAGGVTTIQVLPGSGNLIGGRAVTVKLREGQSGRQLHFRGAPDGLKMACGENPKRVYGTDKRTPMSRMGNLALQRAAFLRAKKLEADWTRYQHTEGQRRADDASKLARYRAEKADRDRKAAWCVAEGEPSSCEELRRGWRDKPLVAPTPTEPTAPPDRDPGLETLVAAMKGRVLVQVHCYRADDMLSMLALGDEVGFRVRSFHHALEAYKIRDILAAREVSVSTWADWWGFKMEAFDGIQENLGLVHEAGARAIVHTDSPEGIQRMNQEAAKGLAKALQAGVQMTEDDAIRWLTSNPAWALGIDQRVGTLEVGKDADVVLWDRDPLSFYARAEQVYIDGVLRYRLGDPRWSDFELGQPAAATGGAK